MILTFFKVPHMSQATGIARTSKNGWIGVKKYPTRPHGQNSNDSNFFKVPHMLKLDYVINQLLYLHVPTRMTGFCGFLMFFFLFHVHSLVLNQIFYC